MRVGYVVRIDRDRPARPVNRLVVLLQAQIRGRFPAVPKEQRRIERTHSNRFVKKFEALFKLTEE